MMITGRTVLAVDIGEGMPMKLNRLPMPLMRSLLVVFPRREKMNKIEKSPRGK